MMSYLLPVQYTVDIICNITLHLTFHLYFLFMLSFFRFYQMFSPVIKTLSVIMINC